MEELVWEGGVDEECSASSPRSPSPKYVGDLFVCFHNKEYNKDIH